MIMLPLAEQHWANCLLGRSCPDRSRLRRNATDTEPQMINTLTAKRRQFVEEYLKDANGTQAAIRAGYSPKTANEQAARLLANASVAAEVGRQTKARSARTGITADRVLRELANIAFFDIGKAFDNSGALLSLDKMDEGTRRVLSSVEFTADFHRAGAVKKIKIADKLRALELLGRHLGLWKEDKPPVDDENPLAKLLRSIQGTALKPTMAAAKPENECPPPEMMAGRLPRRRPRIAAQRAARAKEARL